MQSFHILVLLPTIVGHWVTGPAVAQQPECVTARAVVLCDVGGVVQEISTEPFPCPPDPPKGDCCYFQGEVARLHCALQLGGVVLETQCHCLAAIPATGGWGLLVSGLFLLTAGTLQTSRSHRSRVAFSPRELKQVFRERRSKAQRLSASSGLNRQRRGWCV